MEKEYIKVGEEPKSPFSDLIASFDRELGLPGIYCLSLVNSLDNGDYDRCVKFLVGYARNTRDIEKINEEQEKRESEIFKGGIERALHFLRENGYEIPCNADDVFSDFQSEIKGGK